VVKFKAPSQHLPGGTEYKHEKLQGNGSPGRDMNVGPPEYEAGVFFFCEGGVGLVPKRGCLLTLAYYAFPR
jgi:hypothetical protein